MSKRGEWLPAGVRVVPVLTVADGNQTVALCRALHAGGLPCAEVTLRRPGALGAIQTTTQALPGFVLGAGTVLNARQARDAISAGARFLVSPGFDDQVVAVGQDAGVPVIPGVATATEAQRAYNAGLRRVKFFPAATSGGTAALRAMKGPFPDLAFLATGGIGPATLGDWLALDNVFAVGGSWLVPNDFTAAGTFDEVENRARDAVTLSAGASI